MNLLLEISAVGLSLTFLFLLIKENIYCWFFGITGSLVSIFLFYNIGLYAESILNFYYVIIGFYGYYLWNAKKKSSELPINEIASKTNLLFVGLGIILAFSLGYVLDQYTEASNPYLDAFTTIFSFIASYLEAKKVLSGWYYWIVINGLTIGLYLNKGLYFYFALTLLYFALSIYGLREWKKKVQVIR
jgi:nicotinamide mononucleotide transporter